MTTLTKTEIRWIMNMAASSHEISLSLAEDEENNFRALHKLHAENMSSIYDKLDKLLKDGGKRIAIK